MEDAQVQAPKQQLSEQIRKVTNILVTVSRDPTIDELSAALGLTMMLNKLGKHGTAVFSGKIPPALNFLDPQKTFEGTVDSLRDFIIALDKEKADRLRYKVEDDVVRIFITPYKTVISEKDLAFSQGDFNVELIIALGVEKRDDLDQVITAHGRILHDSTVATINAHTHQSDLGAIDWTDPTAGSYCEMLMSLSESLQSGIIDEQIATTLLTGIVAATERFSNTQTTPKVMTMAAQLMAAGANQQLIAMKLEEGNALPTPDKKSKNDKKPKDGKKKADNGEMQIEHTAPTDAEQAVEKAEELADSAEDQAETETEDEDTTDNDEPVRNGNDSSDKQDKSEKKKPVSKKSDVSVASLKADLAAVNDAIDKAANSDVSDNSASDKPLNSSRKRLNREMALTPPAPLNAASPGTMNYEPPTIDPFAAAPGNTAVSGLQYEVTDSKGQTIQPLSPLEDIKPEPIGKQQEKSTKATLKDAKAEADVSPMTLSELEAQAQALTPVSPVGDARAAVNAALDALPFNPSSEPLVAQGAQPLSGPSLHDMPPLENTLPSMAGPVPPSMPAPPPLPDFSSLPPLPGEAPTAPPLPPVGTTNPFTSEVSVPAPNDPTQPTTESSGSNDPGQFKLPGQA